MRTPRQSAVHSEFSRGDTIPIGERVPLPRSSAPVNEAYETLIDPGTRQSYDLSLRWAQPQMPIPVEPMVAQSGPFPQEDAGLFGRYIAPLPSSVFQTSAGFDDLFAEWRHSLEELFFDSEW